MSHTRVSANLAAVAIAIAIAIPLRAQTRPNFLGKWTVVIEKSIPATLDRHGREITIAQDGQMLTLTQFGFRSTGVATITPGGVPSFSSPPTREEFQYSTTYDCDGTEHPTPQDALMTPVPPKPPTPSAAVVTIAMTVDSVYRAIWTRDQLVIVTRRTTTSTPSSGTPITNRSVSRKALSLDAEGLLVVDSITISEPTPNGPTQPAPVPLHSVYRKAS
jgi:hypothetical protein